MRKVFLYNKKLSDKKNNDPDRYKSHSLMQISVGISDQRRAYLTGLTCSCGSRSTCMWSIRRQNDARRSAGSDSSAIHLPNMQVNHYQQNIPLSK